MTSHVAVLGVVLAGAGCWAAVLFAPRDPKEAVLNRLGLAAVILGAAFVCLVAWTRGG